MSKKKIIAVTGARSEYDLMFSIYKKLEQDVRFDFEIIVTGAHLSEKFGTTNNVLCATQETNNNVRKNRDWEDMKGRAVI